MDMGFGVGTLLAAWNIIYGAARFAFYILGIVCMVKYLSGRRN